MTIDGTGFSNASTVKFGTAPATGVTYVSVMKIMATSPAGAGVEDVTVATSGETSSTSPNDEFTYVPSVTSVSPSSGPGGRRHCRVIDGSGFTAASAVKFGTTAAASVTHISASQIQATAPAAAAVGPCGCHRDHVRRDIGHIEQRPVHLVAERDGREIEFGSGGGGTVVTITGSGFTTASTVEFGTTAATGVTFDSVTQITDLWLEPWALWTSP